MTYRIMRAEDYDGAFALWQSTPGMGLNSLDDSREGIVRYLERNPQTCFVAEEADRICGTVLSGDGDIFTIPLWPGKSRGRASEAGWWSWR